MRKLRFDLPFRYLKNTALFKYLYSENQFTDKYDHNHQDCNFIIKTITSTPMSLALSVEQWRRQPPGSGEQTRTSNRGPRNFSGSLLLNARERPYMNKEYPICSPGTPFNCLSTLKAGQFSGVKSQCFARTHYVIDSFLATTIP